MKLDQIENVEEHKIDGNKYTQMTFDETENIIVNNIKLTKNGTMDDVYILEKVDKEDIQSILFIHSCVPQIKEFTFNLRFKQQILTSPYMKGFEELLSQLIFFLIKTETKDPLRCDGVPN